MSSSYRASCEQSSAKGCLRSGTTSYQVLSLLGQGASAQVVKCTRADKRKTVAVKMIKNQGRCKEQAREEIAALHKIKSLDSEKCNIVQWNDSFVYKGYICLEFEHLDRSLYDFMKERHFKPLHLKEISPVVKQLANALDHLKTAGIIHGDLKLENVMLVNHSQEPYRVKVIDFGLACEVSAARRGLYIQSRPYRSPEILLGLPFTEAIDMWSLGCMAAGLFLGDFLYPGASEYDMMRYIVETHGQPPESLLNSGQKTQCFFQKFYSRSTSIWKLKSQAQYRRETGIESRETRRFALGSLDDLLRFSAGVFRHSADKGAGPADLRTFVDVLKGMLQLDASKRITPRQVLEHHFSSLCQSKWSYSSNTKTSRPVHKVCPCPPAKRSCQDPPAGRGQPSGPVSKDCHRPPAKRSRQSHPGGGHKAFQKARPLSPAGPSGQAQPFRRSQAANPVLRKCPVNETIGEDGPNSGSETVRPAHKVCPGPPTETDARNRRPSSAEAVRPVPGDDPYPGVRDQPCTSGQSLHPVQKACPRPGETGHSGGQTPQPVQAACPGLPAETSGRDFTLHGGQKALPNPAAEQSGQAHPYGGGRTIWPVYPVFPHAPAEPAGQEHPFGSGQTMWPVYPVFPQPPRRTRSGRKRKAAGDVAVGQPVQPVYQICPNPPSARTGHYHPLGCGQTVRPIYQIPHQPPVGRSAQFPSPGGCQALLAVQNEYSHPPDASGQNHGYVGGQAVRSVQQVCGRPAVDPSGQDLPSAGGPPVQPAHKICPESGVQDGSAQPVRPVLQECPLPPPEPGGQDRPYGSAQTIVPVFPVFPHPPRRKRKRKADGDATMGQATHPVYQVLPHPPAARSSQFHALSCAQTVQPVYQVIPHAPVARSGQFHAAAAGQAVHPAGQVLPHPPVARGGHNLGGSQTVHPVYQVLPHPPVARSNQYHPCSTAQTIWPVYPVFPNPPAGRRKSGRKKKPDGDVTATQPQLSSGAKL